MKIIKTKGDFPEWRIFPFLEQDDDLAKTAWAGHISISTVKELDIFAQIQVNVGLGFSDDYVDRETLETRYIKFQQAVEKALIISELVKISGDF